MSVIFNNGEGSFAAVSGVTMRLLSGAYVVYPTFADFPNPPLLNLTGKIFVAEDTGDSYIWNGAAYVQINSTVEWGAITGTLSNQTDLQNALNAKAPNQLASETQNGMQSSVFYTQQDNTNKEITASDQTIDYTTGNVTSGGNLSTNTVNGSPLSNSFLLNQYNYIVNIRLNYVSGYVILPNIPLLGISSIYTKTIINIRNDANSSIDAIIYTSGTQNNDGVNYIPILGMGNSFITNAGGGLVIPKGTGYYLRWTDTGQLWVLEQL